MTTLAQTMQNGGLKLRLDKETVMLNDEEQQLVEQLKERLANPDYRDRVMIYGKQTGKNSLKQLLDNSWQAV